MLIEDLIPAGYEVAPAMFTDTDEHATVHYVSGQGVQTYVAEDDDEMLASLVAASKQRRSVDLRAHTKDDLLELARVRGIDGRSKMQRDELEFAVWGTYSKEELLAAAQERDIEGRSSMSKEALFEVLTADLREKN